MNGMIPRRGAGYAGAGCAGLATIVLGLTLWSLLETLLVPSPTASDFELASLDKRAEAHDANFDAKLLAQLEGRSMFFVPPKPPPPPPPPSSDEPREQRPPPPPSRYSGPKLIAIFDGQAWFGDGVRLGVGEEFDGVEVLELSPPWQATVRWRGVEFTIDLFERDRIILPKK